MKRHARTHTAKKVEGSKKLLNERSCYQLTSVRFESFERHGLFVVIVFILPHVVTATRAALAPVVEVGHFKLILCTLTTENTFNQPKLQTTISGDVKSLTARQFGNSTKKKKNSSDFYVRLPEFNHAQRWGDRQRGEPSLWRHVKTASACMYVCSCVRSSSLLPSCSVRITVIHPSCILLAHTLSGMQSLSVMLRGGVVGWFFSKHDEVEGVGVFLQPRDVFFFRSQQWIGFILKCVERCLIRFKQCCYTSWHKQIIIINCNKKEEAF